MTQSLNPNAHHRISMRAIRSLARRIAEEFQPEKIILFGSYAYGKPKPESDVDLAGGKGDYLTAEREMRVRKCPNYDAVCFHVQQCDYAVSIRYPCETATKEEARAALKAVRIVRAFIRQRLSP